ncbi:MAG: hypothetical protein ABSH23_10270 [Steroidobacteraceae bacterium]
MVPVPSALCVPQKSAADLSNSGVDATTALIFKCLLIAVLRTAAFDIAARKRREYKAFVEALAKLGAANKKLCLVPPVLRKLQLAPVSAALPAASHLVVHKSSAAPRASINLSSRELP